MAMLLPSGDTLFGNYVDVTDDFRMAPYRVSRPHVGQVTLGRGLNATDQRHQDAVERRRLYALPAMQDRSQPPTGLADQVA